METPATAQVPNYILIESIELPLRVVFNKIGKSNVHRSETIPFNTWTFVSGVPDPWSDWSECQADCPSNKTVKGTMTRSRKIKLHGKYREEDEVQAVDCDNPCPLGICPTVKRMTRIISPPCQIAR